jgi:hypothetical protein
VLVRLGLGRSVDGRAACVELQVEIVSPFHRGEALLDR